jgi:hypothetical protein
MRRFSCRAVLGIGTALAIGGLASVAPASSRHVSIAAVPNPINAGDPVVIVGHLSGSSNSGQKVRLFHRLAGKRRFSFVQAVRTDSHGNYAIVRRPGVVDTNRAWFVRSNGARSRTVRERVHALVTLAASTTQAGSNQPVVFTGHVTPNHRGGRVLLQRQVGQNGDDWRTIDSGHLDRGSNYRIVHRFRVPNSDGVTLRAVIRRDRRNLAGASSSVDVVVSQNQNPAFMLTASADPISAGQSVTLSGVLAGPSNAHQVVTLYGHENGGPYAPIVSTTTDGSGRYSFTQSPRHTTVYQARTANGRRSAQVFEAVRDVIAGVNVEPSQPKVGQVVSVKGMVAPSKAGHLIELQRRGRDGDYHTIEAVRVNGASGFEFLIRFSRPGTKQLRVHIDGGPANWGASSDPVSVHVLAARTPTAGGPTVTS